MASLAIRGLKTVCVFFVAEDIKTIESYIC
jgi:hypothetical protein